MVIAFKQKKNKQISFIASLNIAKQRLLNVLVNLFKQAQNVNANNNKISINTPVIYQLKQHFIRFQYFKRRNYSYSYYVTAKITKENEPNYKFSNLMYKRKEFLLPTANW